MSEQRNAERDREIIAAATAGPWKLWDRGEVVSETETNFEHVLWASLDQVKILITDHIFIAEARQAFPHWLERAVAAEEDAHKLEEEVERLRNVLLGAEQVAKLAEQRVAELERLVAELDEKLTDAENEIAWRRG